MKADAALVSLLKAQLRCNPDQSGANAAIARIWLQKLQVPRCGFDVPDINEGLALLGRQLSEVILDSVIPNQQAEKTPKPKLGLEDFALRTAELFEKRCRNIPPKELKDHVQYMFEVINASLGSSVRALSQYDRPEKVPKPSPNK